MKRSIVTFTRNAKFALGNLVGMYPKLYFPIAARLHPNSKRHLVHPKTELLIAGYPRSANTFVEIAIRSAQAREMNLASHFHVPAQVHRAFKLGVPVIVLVRNPKDAVASACIRDPAVSLRMRFWAYSMFYEAIAPLKSNFVIASFERATQELPDVVAEVNQKFRTEFSMPETTESFVADIYSRIDDRSAQRGTLDEMKVCRPSNARAKQLPDVLAKIQEDRFGPSLKRALTIYRNFVPGS